MIDYIGFRIEVANRVIGKNIEKTVKKYNKNNTSKIFDWYIDGKIIVEKRDSMVIARGTKNTVKKKSTNINFALMVPIEQSKVNRLVQIINVLGNGKLIRERVKTFANGISTLNHIPELKEMVPAIHNLEKISPGLITSSWYYAPEMRCEGE